jgi:hypothetical protein
MTSINRAILSVGIVLSLVAGCSREPEKNNAPTSAGGKDVGELTEFLEKPSERVPARPVRPAAAGESDAAAGLDALPPGHPPIGAAPPAQAPATGGEAGTPNLKYDVPEGWESKPAGGMRFAQYSLPKAQGASGDATMIIYYFGPGGAGGIQPNLDRWRGMFSNENGEAVGPDGYSTQQFQVGEMPVTLLEIRGRYFDPMTVRDATEPTKEEYVMFAAVVETPGDGPFFFKTTGPAATMEAQRDAFMKMLRSARP